MLYWLGSILAVPSTLQYFQTAQGKDSVLSILNRAGIRVRFLRLHHADIAVNSGHITTVLINNIQHCLIQQRGQLTFTAEDTEISIAKDGTISSSLGVKGRLRVVSFENQQGLERIGANLYTGENPVPAQNVRVLQGAIEKSNVSGVAEVSRMIEITRNYTAVSKMISDNEDLRKKAIERLGSAQA